MRILPLLRGLIHVHGDPAPAKADESPPEEELGSDPDEEEVHEPVHDVERHRPAPGDPQKGEDRRSAAIRDPEPPGVIQRKAFTNRLKVK